MALADYRLCDVRDRIDAFLAPDSAPAVRCPATLGNAGQCVKEAGHDGQHSLVDVTRPDDRWAAADSTVSDKRQIQPTSCAAIYDNPETMAREAWIDGRMVGHIQAQVLMQKGFKGGDWFPFQFNVGPWETGRVCGDKTAIADQPSGCDCPQGKTWVQHEPGCRYYVAALQPEVGGKCECCGAYPLKCVDGYDVCPNGCRVRIAETT